MSRFTDNDLVKEQRQGLMQLQKQILEQQIKEKQIQKARAKADDQRERVKLQNQMEREYQEEFEKNKGRKRVRPPGSKSPAEEELNELPYEPINYLANSHNIHEVLNSMPDSKDERRKKVNYVVRGSPQSHRSRGSPQNQRSPEQRITVQKASPPPVVDDHLSLPPQAPLLQEHGPRNFHYAPGNNLNVQE